MFLPGQVFEFRDAGVCVVVRIIHDGHGLKLRLVQGLMFKLQAPIREFAEFES